MLGPAAVPAGAAGAPAAGHSAAGSGSRRRPAPRPLSVPGAAGPGALRGVCGPDGGRCAGRLAGLAEQ